MLTQIKGLHHVTSLASDAQTNNDFFTKTLGLRRVKKTVNFDNPNVYHLYYGDAAGTPGSVMTYFPFQGASQGRHGVGEVGLTGFAIPAGSQAYWSERLSKHCAKDLESKNQFGESRLHFTGPDGDEFALIEAEDTRAPWTGAGVDENVAIRGFHSVSMRLRDRGASAELLTFMGYQKLAAEGQTTRYFMPTGNGADVIDIETLPIAQDADQGAGSVHHIAFAVEDRAAQLEVRKALLDTGYQVTPVIDRDYFWAIYFRTPGGVLFEVATNEPGFARDEDSAHLGQSLRLPSQHEHLRKQLETELLQPIVD